MNANKPSNFVAPSLEHSSFEWTTLRQSRIWFKWVQDYMILFKNDMDTKL